MSQFQEFVVRNGRETVVSAGDHIFVQGDFDSNVYFIKSGLLKAYYIRSDGKEHIKSFLSEGSIIGSMVVLMDADPCSFSLAALEDGAVIGLPFAQLKQAAAQDVGLANILIDFLSEYGKRKERREFELLSQPPEERYSILLETMTDLADRVSQADLAAYIGVTPQALSRIKRRVKA